MNHRRHQRIAWFLVIVTAVSPSLALAQPPTEPREDKIDLSYVTPDGLLAAVLRPRRALTSPAMETLPVEVFSAAGRQEFGIDPLDIEQVILVLQPPAAGPPEVGVVVRLARPFALENLKPAGDPHLRKTELEGRPYYQSPHPATPGFYMPDDRTLLVAGDASLRKMLDNRRHSTDGALRTLLSQTDPRSDIRVVVAVAPNREAVATQVNTMPVPPQWAGFAKLPELIDWAELDAAFSGENYVRFQLVSATENDAADLQARIVQLLNIGRTMFLAQMASEMTGDDPVQQAMARYMERMTTRTFDMFRPQRDGNRVRIALQGDVGAQWATTGVAVALLLPALETAREAARRAQSVNNMKQLALAMQVYHDAHGTLPPRASYDEDGQPLLSWRVHVLPYLDQQALYLQFHLDEPWDSEHNRTLIERMPALYANPSANLAPGMASYLLPVGEGTVFEGREGVPFRKIFDGTSNTIVLVEVNEAAAGVWTKPEELNIRAEAPLTGLGAAHPGGFAAAFADGSVSSISSDIDPRAFLAMLTMAGREPVER